MLNVLYFGMSGAFSGPPLAALLEAGISVRAIVMPSLAGSHPANGPAYHVLAPAPPAPRRPLPLLGPVPGPGVLELAGRRRIPVLEVTRFRDPSTVEALAAYAPDAICVACFSRRLPIEVLRLPRLGCLNVHPSLLPDNRGPDPLFWTFWRGDPTTGVTVHLMDEGLDTGPILLQERIPVPDGLLEAALERECAERGARLLVEALRQLEWGRAHPVPQDPALASTYPWPSPEDYTITPDRPARWAFNFARALGGRAQPITIVTEDARYRVLAPLGYDSAAALDQPAILRGDELWLRCSPGVFHARAALAE